MDAAHTLRPDAPETESGAVSSTAQRHAPGSGESTRVFPLVGDGQSLITSRATVLMVDDEPMVLEVIRAFLEQAGYRNFAMTSRPAEAVALARSSRADIVLLDLVMPEVTGFEILEQMRRDPDLRYLPVIIVSGNSDPETKLKALELGATDILPKPVDPSELRLRVRNALAFKSYQDRLNDYDALTELPNRRRFIADASRALERARQGKRMCALMHLDLDRFKQINDTLGHRIGDKLLRAVAEVLEKALPDLETTNWRRLREPEASLALARISGNGFAALLMDLPHLDAAGSVARRTLSELAKPFYIDGQQMYVTASIGLACFPVDGEDVETLMKHAEMAMYQAKEAGRDTYEFFSEELNARALERLALETQLRKALVRDQFVLYYQPKVDLSARRIIGAEALLRWKHPDLGMVSPVRFIPIAEETGLITEIGEWVLHAATRQARAWSLQGLPPISISVNVSGIQFRQGRVLDAVRRALQASGTHPGSLVLELTESILMEGIDQNVETLSSLKAVGVKLSMDDFGTGYSSLTYLSRFPIDELKVDRTFVSGVPTNRDSVAIVTAVVAMAKALELKVVAEGVETEEQLAFLRSLNCDVYQGNYCSRPVPPEPFADLLRRSQT